MPTIYKLTLGPAPSPQAAADGAASVSASVNVLRALDVEVRTLGITNPVASVLSGGAFGAVNDLAVTAVTSTTVTVQWTQVADDQGGPAKYQVRIRSPTIDADTYGEAYPSQIYADTNLAVGVAKSVQFTNLLPGTAYGAILIPFRGPSGAGEAFGSFSNVPTTTTSAGAQLGTITNLVASAGDGQVFLSWTPAANATSHQPQYRLTGAGGFTNFGSPLGGSAGSVTVTGLENGSQYEFRVVAGDGVATTNSNVPTATPGALGPNEPASYSIVTTRSFQAASEAGWWGPIGNASEWEIVSESTPEGDNSALRFIIPAGAPGGSHNPPTLGLDISGRRELYIRFRHRTSSVFSVNGSGEKLVYVYGRNGDTINWYLTVAPGHQAGSTYQFRSGMNSQQVPQSWWEINRTAVPVTKGQWALVEVRFVVSSPGGSDGQFHMWVNGVRTHEYYDRQYIGPTQAQETNAIQIYPIPGGDNTVVPQQQEHHVDSFYASGLV